MRAAVAVVTIVALLAFPPSLGAFLPGIAGPAAASSPSGPSPSSPHLFPSPGAEFAGARRSVLLAEVFYFAYRDNEYVVLENVGSDSLDLAGWRLSDLEGTVVFPENSTLVADARAVVTRNATSYREDTLDEPEFAYGPGSERRMLVTHAILQFNNEGDEVLLLDPNGTVIDVFVYGGSPYGGAGWFGTPARTVSRGERAVRLETDGRLLDSDTAADWDSLRAYGLGQSAIPFAPMVAQGGATAFLSPDDSLEILDGLIDRARLRIWASLYTLTNPYLSTSLQAAAARAVDVRVLLEGQPVGGIDPREWTTVLNLEAAGGSVRFLADDRANGTFARYRFLHAKYAVIDGAVTVLGSENWGEHGFPLESRGGNRGWNVAIEDQHFAGYFESLFLVDYDPRRRDSLPMSSFTPILAENNDTASNTTRPFAIESVRIDGPLRVTPVIAPDHTLREDAVFGLLRSATRTLDIEAFRIARTWGDLPNPYLEAVIDAARRGVQVRVLLDGTWYNTEDTDPTDNDDAVAYLAMIAERESLPLEAKLGSAAAHYVTKFHNKGVLVDGERVFVSSLNWNRNAATRNREVGVILESAALVEPFRLAFEHDWRNDVTAPLANAGPDLVAHVGTSVVLSAAASFDDVAIVSYEWSVGRNGRTVFGRVVEVMLHEVGVVEVLLTVRDGSGNEGLDTAVITVLAAGPRISLANPFALPMATLLAVNLALIWAYFRRRRATGKGLSDEDEMEPRG